MWPVRDLVPHGEDMLLLDAVEGSGSNWLEVGIRISEDSVFFDPGFGVPSWIGLEYMAQTVAAYIGLAARKASQKPRIGFLLGTRAYNSSIAHFALGEKLVVRVEEEWTNDQMGAFSSRIVLDSDRSGDILAQAQLVVFQPLDLSKFLEEHAQ